jgi:hypothetical protein
MSPIQRGELENIVNAQIAGMVVLSCHLKWIKSREGKENKQEAASARGQLLAGRQRRMMNKMREN